MRSRSRQGSPEALSDLEVGLLASVRESSSISLDGKDLFQSDSKNNKQIFSQFNLLSPNRKVKTSNSMIPQLSKGMKRGILFSVVLFGMLIMFHQLLAVSFKSASDIRKATLI